MTITRTYLVCIYETVVGRQHRTCAFKKGLAPILDGEYCRGVLNKDLRCMDR
jgi:hypothetical protein